MKEKNIGWYIKSLCILFILIGIDQGSKLIASLHLKDKSSIPIIKNVFELEYLENKGAAFGIFQGKQLFLILFTGVIILALFWGYTKLPLNKRFLPLRICLLLIIAGAICNLIDRIAYQYVVDFLYFKLIQFPIFNIADCYVTISAVVMILLVLFYYKDEDFSFIKIKEKNGGQV